MIRPEASRPIPAGETVAAASASAIASTFPRSAQSRSCFGPDFTTSALAAGPRTVLGPLPTQLGKPGPRWTGPCALGNVAFQVDRPWPNCWLRQKMGMLDRNPVKFKARDGKPKRHYRWHHLPICPRLSFTSRALRHGNIQFHLCDKPFLVDFVSQMGQPGGEPTGRDVKQTHAGPVYPLLGSPGRDMLTGTS